MSMTPQLPPAYDEFIEFIVKSGGPEAVLAFKPSEATQDRAYELIYKEREGVLDAQEKAELNHYTELDHLFAMAKIRARLLLAENKPMI